MLKISEMAKLANTTRRTLIFYDEQNVFKPSKKNQSGYRYYEYNQLYELMFILGLRNLGISLDEIKKIENNSEVISSKQLIDAQNRIENKMKELSRIQSVINKKIEQQKSINEIDLYQPKIQKRIKKIFWCSKEAASCTDEEIAQLFSEFYKNLDSLTVMDTSTSGFLTKLSLNDPKNYDDASFRIIKETIDQNCKVLVPTMEKASGDYACILVENDLQGIKRGLTILKEFCKNNKINTQNYLWQINSDDSLIENGATKYGWLEYSVI